ncbi:IMPACT family protein [Polaribacter glomeratus]|uniref:YigZ family protein n=1 Tax=Polaribacter glomeratus TaxID=102 RepID=A0A2S7WXQ2_9FLAO|nr:YigZ family protein [Polaribacter glomeratus]PQJ82343.1 YigZ family protein [Polaribacter glomeratus]TXD64558.1 YigZ family protein [Polaribacter glomeratus]
MEEDSYKTILKASKETLFKEKGSKFFGYAFPVLNEEDVKDCLEELKKKHHSARHFCYAYQIGVEDVKYRANDDGEPNNSAGLPIYGQIQSFEVTNILIVSVRYFGGTKLGVGGLISAYKTSAQLTLEASKILEKTIDVHFKLNFEYDLMNAVQRIIKEKNLEITHQKLELACEYVISIRKKDAPSIFEIFENLYKVDIKELES